MRGFLLVVAALALCGGYAYSDDIGDEIAAEALRVTGAHKAKLEAEEAVQKQKDQELEKQQNLQAEQIRKEIEEERAQDRMRQADLKTEEAKRQLEVERRQLEEEKSQLEERQRLTLIHEAEVARKAKINQILHNMQQALDAYDRQQALKEMERQAQIDNQIQAQKRIQDAQRRFVEGMEADRRQRNMERQLDLWGLYDNWRRGR